MALLQACLEMEPGKFEPLILAKWYDFFAKSDPQIKLHPGTQAALKTISDQEGKEIRDLIKVVKEKVQQLNSKNQSNGALIRAPFMAVVGSFAEKSEHMQKAVSWEANFTHCHQNAINASLIMAMALNKLFKKVPPTTVHEQLLDHAKQNKMGDIITWLELAKKFDG